MAQATYTVEITQRLVAAEILRMQAKAERTAQQLRSWATLPPASPLEALLRASLLAKGRAIAAETQQDLCAAGLLLLHLQDAANDEGGFAPNAA